MTPLDVLCPRCGAVAGEKCHTSQGSRPHDARLGEATRQNVMAARPTKPV